MLKGLVLVEDSNSLPDRSDLQIHHFKKVRAITFIQKSTSITGKNESPVSHRGANFFLSYFFFPTCLPSNTFAARIHQHSKSFCLSNKITAHFSKVEIVSKNNFCILSMQNLDSFFKNQPERFITSFSNYTHGIFIDHMIQHI